MTNNIVDFLHQLRMELIEEYPDYEDDIIVRLDVQYNTPGNVIELAVVAIGEHYFRFWLNRQDFNDSSSLMNFVIKHIAIAISQPHER